MFQFDWILDGWWLILVYLCHAGILYSVFSNRNDSTTLVSIIVLLAGLIASADALNYVFIEFQEIFASRAYFDTSGILTRSIFTLPLTATFFAAFSCFFVKI